MPKPIARPTFLKSPTSRQDFAFDVAKSLQTDETIDACTWTITANPDPAAGTTLVKSTTKTPYINGSQIGCFWEAGTIDRRYTVTATFTTSMGRIDTRTADIVLVQK